MSEMCANCGYARAAHDSTGKLTREIRTATCPGFKPLLH